MPPRATSISAAMGDVDTLTVAEYRELSWSGRLGYRLMRNPFVMLGIGPLWALLLEPRLIPGWARKRFWAQDPRH